jgi:hypothetical protein
MSIKTFHEYPDDVLDAADMLLTILLGQPSRRLSDWRRPPYSLSIERAYQLLNVVSRYRDGKKKWTLVGPPKSKWEQRLELAGVDPVSLEVVDQKRWNLAWLQLSTTNKFLAPQQRTNIALKIEAPIAAVVTHIKAVQRKSKALPKSKELAEDDENDEDQDASGSNIYSSGVKKRVRRRIIT